MTEDPAEAKKPDSPLSNLLFCCGAPLALALFFGLLAGGCTYLSSDDRDPEPSYTAAIEACRAEVRPALKDPDSAEFSDETYSENEDGLRWRIRGTVRATNSFGATTPNEYECIASWRGDEFTAEVTRLG